MSSGATTAGLLAVLGLMIAGSAAAANVTGASPASPPAPIALPLAFPLAFEENRGQHPDGARFTARTGSVRAVLLDHGFELHDGRSNLTLELVGARAGLQPTAEAPVPGVVHYFRGPSPADRIENVRRFTRVRYSRVWPGIDMLVHSRGGQIEYDFELSPGADPSLIAMSFTGTQTPHISRQGRLVLSLGVGATRRALEFDAPDLYQATQSGPIPIEGAYRMVGSRQIGFEVADYDRALALTIDPVVLAYATRLGGSGSDQLTDLALDSTGAIYAVGSTSSADFLGAGGAPLGTDAFVAKLTPDGSALIYVTIFGGAAFDSALGVVADASGNAYVSGHTESAGFPTLNAYQSALAGGADAFVTRLDATGVMTYSTFYGGTDLDGRFAGGIALAPSGIAYVIGRTQSMSNLPTVNPFQTACVTTPCSFAAGFDTSLSGVASLVYGTYLAGNGSGGGMRAGTDGSGNVYVFGFTGADSGLIDVTQGFQASTGDLANRDHYLVVLDPSLVGAAQRIYSTYIGAPGDEPESGDIDVRADGVVLITGKTDSTAGAPDPFPTKNPFQANNAGAEDAYALKVDTTLTGSASLIWSTFLGTTGSDGGNGIAFDSSGGAVIGLDIGASGFGLVAPLPMYDPPPGDRSVLVQLSSDGQTMTLATPITAAGRVAIDATNRIILAGATNKTDFALEASLPPSPLGGADLFLARLDAGVAGLSLELGDSADPVGNAETFAFRERVVNGGPTTESATITLDTDNAPGASFTPAPCFNVGMDLQCEFFEEPLAPGENITIWLMGASTTDGTETVAASVSSPNADPNPADNSDSEGTTVATGAIGIPAGVLTISDFDANGARFDIGAFAIDTARGIMATGNGTLDDGWNFMVFEGSIPLHIVEIFSQGLVAFGFVERATWTPSSFDNGDLIGEQFDAPADRVFAVVDQWGHVELRSGNAFNPGIVIASGAVDLDPDKAFTMTLDIGLSTASVLYDGNLVVSGDPFPADPAAADSGEVGDDFVVSIGYGNGFLGAAIISNTTQPIADSDSDGVPDASDNCPFFANGVSEAAIPFVGDQVDSDGDTIGDPCQCGDVDLDGFIDADDVTDYRNHLADPVGNPFSTLATDKCNVTSPVRPCDLLDVVLLRRAIALLPPGIMQACTNANP